MTTKLWKCPSTDEWINKMWYIHAMEYYLTIKRNEVLLHAATWMDLKNITLSKGNQMQQVTFCMIPFT